MAVWIDWGTRTIHVPRDDMLLVQSFPTEIRELNIDTFRRELKALEDDEEGMPFPDTHRHNTTVSLGGVTYARVIEIINGYTITFEDGQYAVNLVGANSNIGDVTNVNQVSVRSANSAGLTYSKEVEDQSFLDARIWIDTDNGRSGTQYPRGTPADPVDNPVDAQGIMVARSLPRRIHLKGMMNAGDTVETDWSHTNWLGADPTTSAIIFTGPQDAHATTFRRLTLVGSALGNFSLQDGIIKDFSHFEGDCHNTGFLGNITLPSGSSSNPFYSFINCFSLVPGTGTPIIDCNNLPNLQIQFRDYTGGIEIRNYSDANNNMSIDLLSGHVKLHSSCTAGTIVVRGSGHITDNSSGINLVQLGRSISQIDDPLSKKVWIALK